MKTKLISLSLMLSYAAICGVSNANCLQGVLVGNVAGHKAHYHALAGAAVGFDIGHHMRKQQAHERAAQ